MGDGEVYKEEGSRNREQDPEVKVQQDVENLDWILEKKETRTQIFYRYLDRSSSYQEKRRRNRRLSEQFV